MSRRKKSENVRADFCPAELPSCRGIQRAQQQRQEIIRRIVCGDSGKRFLPPMNDCIDHPLEISHLVTQAAIARAWNEFGYTEQIQHTYATDRAEIGIHR